MRITSFVCHGEVFPAHTQFCRIATVRKSGTLSGQEKGKLMLNLRRLDVLQRFAARGTIAAAAADLGYTPSAVSQQLATLEREAGVALVERTAHTANLTDAG